MAAPGRFPTLLAMSLGPTELLIVLVIVLVLFGGSKLPKLARSLGDAQREFQRGSDGATEEHEDSGLESSV